MQVFLCCFLEKSTPVALMIIYCNQYAPGFQLFPLASNKYRAAVVSVRVCRFT